MPDDLREAAADEVLDNLMRYIGARFGIREHEPHYFRDRDEYERQEQLRAAIVDGLAALLSPR